MTVIGRRSAVVGGAGRVGGAIVSAEANSAIPLEQALAVSGSRRAFEVGIR